MSQSFEDIKRWTARRKAVAVMDIIKGKATKSCATSQPEQPSSGPTSEGVLNSLINDGAVGVSPFFCQILVEGNWVDGLDLPDWRG